MTFVHRRPRLLLFAGAALFGGGATLQGASAPELQPQIVAAPPAAGGDFSVMTYNVKGLPWPIASGRTQALREIGERLAAMRAAGVQPSVVVLQEAFVAEAKEIGDQAGYRYKVFGPPSDSRASAPADPTVERKWYLGETQGKQLDSGLVVLSDFPIDEVRRASFPRNACAGFDCLAAKGVVLVTLDLPGKGRIAVATTHLNSRGASKASPEDADRAYALQTRFLASFLRRERDPAVPLVFAGDFNMGQRPDRMAALPKALAFVAGGRTPPEALRACMDLDSAGLGRSPDAQWTRQRARDMQFVFAGAQTALELVGGAVPFGTGSDGSTLSDHMGFAISYRLVPRSTSPERASDPIV